MSKHTHCGDPVFCTFYLLDFYIMCWLCAVNADFSQPMALRLIAVTCCSSAVKQATRLPQTQASAPECCHSTQWYNGPLQSSLNDLSRKIEDYLWIYIDPCCLLCFQCPAPHLTPALKPSATPGIIPPLPVTLLLLAGPHFLRDV